MSFRHNLGESFSLVPSYSSVSMPREIPPSSWEKESRTWAERNSEPALLFRRFFAVLHVGGIIGPREAVGAAIAAEARRKQ